MTAAEFSRLVKGARRRADGVWWDACCPAHDDRKASLSFRDGDHRLILKCQAGCEEAAILVSLHLTVADLARSAPTGRTRIVAEYDYRDADGTLGYQVVRFDPKGFRQRRPDGAGGWIWNLNGVARVLYRLPSLTGAERVYIPEGEKDVDTLCALGLVATCNTGGAGKWRASDTAALVTAGVREVVVLTDNDEAGDAHALKVAASCLGAGLTVRIVRLPNLEAHGDVSDWLAAGGTRDVLEALVAATGPESRGAPTPVPPPVERSERPERPRAARQTIAAALAPLDALPTSPSVEQLEAALREVAGNLNGTDPLRRQAARTEAIERLKARKVDGPASWVDSALGLTTPDSAAAAALAGRGITLDDPEPWPEPVDVAALLGELAQLARRFVVLPEGGPETLALWVAFTYTLDACDTAPQLVLTSPVKQCGKTKCLELATALVRRALPASNLTAAAAYRVIEKYVPTMIVDEADTFLLENPELRGVMNSGHTRATAFVLRCVGDDAEPRRFSTWCARAIALIGALPATMEDRSITLSMRRRMAGERIERMRHGRLYRDLESVRRRVARWAQDARPALEQADPVMPESLDDRQEDNWRPLLAIADLAGGAWPNLARTAARALAGVRAEDSTLALQLLTDVAEVWPESEEKIPSAALVARLVALADRPWGECNRGKPLTPNALARLLRGFGVKPKNIRIGSEITKGYERGDLTDPFTRYLRGSKPLQPLQVNERKDLDQKSNPLHDRSVADRETGLSSDEQTNVAAVAVPNPREAGRVRYDL